MVTLTLSSIILKNDQTCMKGLRDFIDCWGTAWKVPVFGVFLVHIFPHSDWIRIRKTPNTGTFHAVVDYWYLKKPFYTRHWNFGLVSKWIVQSTRIVPKSVWRFIHFRAVFIDAKKIKVFQTPALKLKKLSLI